MSDVLLQPSHAWPILLAGGRPRRAQTTLPSLPEDVLLEIAEHLRSPADLLHLAQTCSALHPTLLSVLYRSLSLHTRRQSLVTLRALAAKPHLARHVLSLVVCPDDSASSPSLTGGPPRFDPHHSALSLDTTRDVAEAVREAAPFLTSLRSFVWDAPERPPADDMWFALRMSCPKLKNVGASIGSFLPDRHGHVFDFRDLTGFSLNFKEGFYVDHAREAWPDEHVEFPSLWRMLSLSPTLTTLVLSGCSTQPVDLLPLCDLRWPNLRTLILGDVTVQHPHLHQDTSHTLPPFVAFLAAHPTLETLHLGSRCGVPASHLALLSADGNNNSNNNNAPPLITRRALPRLSEFGGTLEHTARLPLHSRARLHTLRLLEPLSLRDVTPLQVSAVLQTTRSLKRLSLAVVLHASYDHGGIMRAVVSGCPGLLELDFTCAYKPCFLLDTFARTIRPLTKLRALHVALVPVPGEEPPSAGATKLARANPRLERFAVTHLRDRTPLPLRLSPFAPFNADGDDDHVVDSYSSGGGGCPSSSFSDYAAAADDAYSDDGAFDEGSSGTSHDDAGAQGLRDAHLGTSSRGGGARARLRALGATGSTSYALVRDTHGLPVRLDALELRTRSYLTLPLPWPYSLLAARFAIPLPVWPERAGPVPAQGAPNAGAPGDGRKFRLGAFGWSGCCRGGTALRRYSHDLRPAGHPDAPRKRWLELLVFDRTPAGEEARLFAFCIFLGAVAAWAFLACLRAK